VTVMIQYLSWVGSRSAVGCMLNVLPNASHFWGHLQTSPIFGPHSAIRLAALNGFAQWCNSIDEDSNLIGYSRLLDIMADYVYCSSTNLLNAKGQHQETGEEMIFPDIHYKHTSE